VKSISHQHLPQRALIMLVAVGLAACAYPTLRRGYANWLYSGTNNLRRIQLACEVEPEDPECALIRAEITEKKSDELAAWEQAVRLNPRSAEVLTEAAIMREMNGDLPGAERLLLRAEHFNQMWLPRWSLANFYFRRNQPADTLKWAKLALSRAYGDRRATFRLCRQAGASDQMLLNDIIAPDEPGNLSAFLYWITEEDRLDVLDQAALKYTAAATPGRGKSEPASNPAVVVSEVIETLLQRGNPAAAHGLWRRLLADRSLRIAGATASQALTNPAFAPEVLKAPGFDWRTPSYEGIENTRIPPDAIRFALTGGQPEAAELLVQAVDLSGSRKWTLHYEYPTRNSTLDRYLQEWILTPWGGSGTIDAENPVQTIAGADGWTQASISWTIPDDARFFRLAFRIHRILGHIRGEGEIQLRKPRLTPQALSEAGPR